jgi:nucleoside 2-deoxyribosyltransferase
MRRRLKIYLSHPPDLRHEIKEWTKELEEKLHVRIYNPFYNVRARKRKGIALFDRGKLRPYSMEEKRKSEEIVERNLEAIRNCDVLIAVLPYPSIGTIMEIFYSGYVLQKPTLVLAYLKGHPWLNAVARIYNTRKEVVNEIRRIREVMNYE